MALRLYVDSSSVIRMATGEHNGPELESQMRRYLDRGAILVSSKLLQLECRRTAIRMNTEGYSYPEIEELASRVLPLPITDEVWNAALAIPYHVKTLDALHLATCLLVSDCLMLTSDNNMRMVARHLGIDLVPLDERNRLAQLVSEGLLDKMPQPVTNPEDYDSFPGDASRLNEQIRGTDDDFVW